MGERGGSPARHAGFRAWLCQLLCGFGQVIHCLSLNVFICKMGVMLLIVCCTELLGESNMVLQGTKVLVWMVTFQRTVGS